jgi:hypothetical protein
MDRLASIPIRVLNGLCRGIAYAIKFRRICFNPFKGLFPLGIIFSRSSCQSIDYHDLLSRDLFNSQISLNCKYLPLAIVLVSI